MSTPSTRPSTARSGWAVKLKLQRELLADVGLPRREHAIEEVPDALLDELRQGLATRAPEQIAPAHELAIEQVRQLEHVLGPADHGDRNGCVGEEDAEPIVGRALARVTLLTFMVVERLEQRAHHVLEGEVEEPRVGVVERAAWVHAGDEKAVNGVIAGARHRQDNRGA